LAKDKSAPVQRQAGIAKVDLPSVPRANAGRVHEHAVRGLQSHPSAELRVKTVFWR
jgi:hypothetical protein